MLVTLAPTSTRASASTAKPVPAETCERRTAKLVRSTIDGTSPAFSTASSALPTMSRAAATSSTRSIRPPASFVNSSSGWKSRIACSTGMGMKSCTWKAQRGAELVDRQPGQVDLADDDLLVGHADDDLLGAELRLGPELLDRAGDGVGVDDLAVAHGAGREGHLPEALEGR